MAAKISNPAYVRAFKVEYQIDWSNRFLECSALRLFTWIAVWWAMTTLDESDSNWIFKSSIISPVNQEASCTLNLSHCGSEQLKHNIVAHKATFCHDFKQLFTLWWAGSDFSTQQVSSWQMAELVLGDNLVTLSSFATSCKHFHQHCVRLVSMWHFIYPLGGIMNAWKLPSHLDLWRISVINDAESQSGRQNRIISSDRTLNEYTIKRW